MTGKSILLVDDSLHNLKLTRFLLEQEGFDVRIAENAEQALMQLEKHTPDLILMDVQLPGMDGLQLTRHLRRDASLSGVPIVAFTTSAIKGDEEIAHASGCDGYVTKPINTRTFANVVRGYLTPSGPHFLKPPDEALLASDLDCAQVFFQLLDQVIEFRCVLVHRSPLNCGPECGQVGKAVRATGSLQLVSKHSCTLIVALY